MAIWLSCRCPAKRQRLVGCHHGNERLLAASLPEGQILPTHSVQVPYDAELTDLGWGRRLGKLPICPEHRKATDDPYLTAGRNS